MLDTKPPYDKFIGNWDVSEEIRVFPDYIQYNTRCWPCWIDYTKYFYKVDWKKLFVKAFEYAYVDFGEDYEETDKFYFLKDWKFDNKVAEEYKKWKIMDWKRIHEELKQEYKDDPDFQRDYTEEDEKEDIETAEFRAWYTKHLAEWHEFKYNWHSRYSRKARNYIIKKIENKDFD